MHELAIIIPAYKGLYLEKALASLANQTDLDFNLYVGDDNSPDSIQEICKDFSNRLNIHYHRFTNNLGSTDLVKQWERCVNLMKDEKWLWLFSDDDIAEKGCVAAFKQALSETNAYYDVYRFNTVVIDNNGKVISRVEESPIVEDYMNLAYNILNGKRSNSMPDHIFNVTKFRELGGFVNFAYAQAADWATSIKFAQTKGLYTIPGPKVLWRNSGTNVSSLAAKNNAKMIKGFLDFVEWIQNRFTVSDEIKYKITREQIREASISNLKHVLLYHYRGIPLKILFSVVSRLTKLFGFSYLEAAVFCLKIRYKTKHNPG